MHPCPRDDVGYRPDGKDSDENRYDLKGSDRPFTQPDLRIFKPPDRRWSDAADTISVAWNAFWRDALNQGEVSQIIELNGADVGALT